MFNHIDEDDVAAMFDISKSRKEYKPLSLKTSGLESVKYEELNQRLIIIVNLSFYPHYFFSIITEKNLVVYFHGLKIPSKFFPSFRIPGIFFRDALENVTRNKDSASLALIQNDQFPNNFIDQKSFIHSLCGISENKYLKMTADKEE
uniref:DUF4806 domain-containing protein n=1 Tax=Strongyloides venezuelensis TaxID=75913 RepID=A0A0K0FJ57_STRVS